MGHINLYQQLFAIAVASSVLACSTIRPIDPIAVLPGTEGTEPQQQSPATVQNSSVLKDEILSFEELEDQHGLKMDELSQMSEEEVVACFAAGDGEQTALASFCQEVMANEVRKLDQLARELEAGRNSGEFSHPELEETYSRAKALHHKMTFKKKVATVIAVGPLHIHDSPGESRHFHADHVADLNFGDSVVVCSSTLASGAPSRRHLEVEWWQIEIYDPDAEPCTADALGWVASQEVTGDAGARCYHDLFTSEEEALSSNEARAATCPKQARRYASRTEALSAQPSQRVASPIFLAAAECAKPDTTQKKRMTEFETNVYNARTTVGIFGMAFGAVMAFFESGTPGGRRFSSNRDALDVISMGAQIMPETVASPLKIAACAVVEAWK